IHYIVITFPMDQFLKKKSPLFFFWTAGASLLLALTYSCQKIEFDTGSSVNISFSTDTLTFDTVFTQVGSTTRYFKIHNKGSRFARIDEVRLGQESSSFRINADGYQGPVIKDLEIPPHDSVYV